MKFVKITHEEYRELKECELCLQLLECGGVDNWECYDWATENLHEQLEELNKEIDLMTFYDD